MGFAGCLQRTENNSDTNDSNSIYAIRPEYVIDVRKTKFKPRPGRTLSERKWRSAFSEDGHLDIGVVLRRVQRGGVHPLIRAEVWEFLLGCYDPNSTYEERNQLRQRKREQYGMWKTECQKMESTIGSGRYVTRPVITEDGQPIQDPSSQGDDAQEDNGDKATLSPVKLCDDAQEDSVDKATSSPVEPCDDAQEENVDKATSSPVEPCDDAQEENVDKATSSPVEPCDDAQEENVDKATSSPVEPCDDAQEENVGKATSSPVEPSDDAQEENVDKATSSPVEPSDDAQVDNGDKATSSPAKLLMPEEPVAGILHQEKIVVLWKRTLHQIGLDVVRTDRALEFYESEANLAKLWDVLAVYAWIDKEIGYCQGMSDLCSPMVILLENEADAFWCFERIMRKVRGNFKSTVDTLGVRSQLSILAKIIKAIDPKLHQHLEDLDGGEYLFAVRMLMALFRREFSIIDAMYLWEMMWAMEYNPNIFTLYEPSETNSSDDSLAKGNNKLLKKYGKFERENMKTGYKEEQSSLSVFLVASILEVKKKRFIMEAKGLDDVVKILNDIILSLDAKKACKEALKVQKKFLSKAKDL